MRPLFTSMAYINLTDAPGSNRRAGGRRDLPPPPTHHGGKMRRIAMATIGGVVVLALLAGTAQARDSVFVPAPSYPHSTLAIKLVSKPRAGGVMRIVVSGSNAPFEVGYPGSGDDLAYQLDAFAQNGMCCPTAPAPSPKSSKTRSTSASPGSRRA